MKEKLQEFLESIPDDGRTFARQPVQYYAEEAYKLGRLSFAEELTKKLELIERDPHDNTFTGNKWIFRCNNCGEHMDEEDDGCPVCKAHNQLRSLVLEKIKELTDEKERK